eukprot:Skav226750  [mRNA]  locus=scaffold3942:68858:72679:- [translate_table: standard]
MIQELDGNKDGKISWEELFAGAGEAEEDLEAWPEEIQKQYKDTFKECDADGDGQISREELPKLFEKMSNLEDMDDEAAEGSEEI